MDATKGVLTLGAVVSSLIFYNALLPSKYFLFDIESTLIDETTPEVLAPPPSHVNSFDDFLGGFATVQETKTPGKNENELILFIVESVFY